MDYIPSNLSKRGFSQSIGELILSMDAEGRAGQRFEHSFNRVQDIPPWVSRDSRFQVQCCAFKVWHYTCTTSIDACRRTVYPTKGLVVGARGIPVCNTSTTLTWLYPYIQHILLQDISPRNQLESRFSRGLRIHTGTHLLSAPSFLIRHLHERSAEAAPAEANPRYFCPHKHTEPDPLIHSNTDSPWPCGRQQYT